MGDWVDDFNSFQGSQGTSLVSPPPKGAKKAPNKQDRLMSELKLIEWHKMANEAAMKTALMQTKTLKSSTRNSPTHREEDPKWMKKVIKEEMAKPLEVTRDFVMDYERRELENSDRLASQVEKHIGTLKTLRNKLEERADLKSRSEEYRKWQRDFSSKKSAVMEGKTLDEFHRSRDGMEVISNSPKKNGSDLSQILDSLTRLSELETRISKLETGNVFESIRDSEDEKMRANEIDFRKKRVMGEKSMKVVYSIQNGVKKRGDGRKPSPYNSNMNARGSGVSAIRQQRQGVGASAASAGGIFLTGVAEEGSVDDRRERQRREQNLKNHYASNGQKELRNRIIANKNRVKDKSLGQKRHEEAMAELQRRKQQLNARKPIPPNAGAPRANKGISAGIKTNNRHLQDFQNMKKNFNKRKEDVIANHQDNGRKKVGNVGIRLGSSTAPSQPISTQNNGHGPSVKVGGTVTRKVQGNAVPMRRPPRFPQNGPPEVNSAPAVAGLNGLRAIRQQRQPR